MSSVFWCLLSDDILEEVELENGRGVRREIAERGRRGGSTGRVRSLAVRLSHHIDVTGKVKVQKLRVQRSARTADYSTIAGNVGCLTSLQKKHSP